VIVAWLSVAGALALVGLALGRIASGRARPGPTGGDPHVGDVPPDQLGL
jgi:hypothetical protein